jgi:hypothetical protein
MLAAVIRLWRSFLDEVSANQPLSIVYTLNMDRIAKLPRRPQSLSHSVIAKENEVDVKASAPLKDCHAVLGEVILTLQSSNPFPNVMDQWSRCVAIGRDPPKSALAATVKLHEVDCTR